MRAEPCKRRCSTAESMTISAAAAVGGGVDVATDDFDYDLPEAAIAQTPLQRRDGSRLLLVDSQGALNDRQFADIAELLRPGDLLVGNETRVRHARLHGRREGGGNAELLVLAPHGDGYACLVRPARRLPPGTCIDIDGELRATVGGPLSGHPGARHVRFDSPGEIEAAIERLGEAPLPPYIRERLADQDRYQTTYASGPAASAAAPTAGLHFTDTVRQALRQRGVDWTTLRLEVGLGTFAPIRTETIDAHVMHEERFDLPAATAARINETRAAGGRIIAIGTTSMRVLESCGDSTGAITARSGSTALYIKPGFSFNVVDGLLTNFHQPRSSLLVLVAAFIGVDVRQAAYQHALDAGYRFLSFGDCMLCWRRA